MFPRISPVRRRNAQRAKLSTCQEDLPLGVSFVGSRETCHDCCSTMAVAVQANWVPRVNEEPATRSSMPVSLVDPGVAIRLTRKW